MKLVLYVFLTCFSFVRSVDPITPCDILEVFAQNISEPCLRQMHVTCNNNELAWKLFDASSKFLTSGMSYSNVIDYGNFPECMSIDYMDPSGRIKGKFCGLSVIVVNIFLTSQTDKILQKHNIDINSKAVHTISLDKFSEIDKDFRDILLPDIPYVLSKYSMCVPDACTPKEVGYFYLYGHLDVFNLLIYTGLPCETKESNTDLEWGDVFAILFFIIIILLMILSTIYDAYCQSIDVEPTHPLMIAFSILYNGKKLLYVSNNKTEQIQCFNGMRFISMMWVMAYHAPVGYEAGILGLENFPEVKEWGAKWTVQYIHSALLAVDTFFFISGFLVAFTNLKTATEQSPIKQIKSVPKMYLHRYLRLTPSMGVMYLVTITFYRCLGSGPNWNLAANMFKETCKKYWWQFFLYIQNYTNPDTMCVNPMWYLSADMQMFILAPLVLIPTAVFIKKHFLPVIGGLSLLTLFWVIMPMIIRYNIDGEAGNIYTSHERFNNFLIGFTFGAVMRMKKNRPFIFSRVMNLILWIAVIVISLAFNIYWHDVIANYDLLKYTLFMGFYRPVWCLCLVFMVYSCYHGYGGIVEWFLTRPSFQILGRLSYSMYVLHVLVEVYAGATMKTLFYFSNYTLFYHWCGHFIVTLILSVFWVLAFEFPMLTIDKYLLGGNKTSANKSKEKTDNDKN